VRLWRYVALFATSARPLCRPDVAKWRGAARRAPSPGLPPVGAVLLTLSYDPGAGATATGTVWTVRDEACQIG
jgi:hypothetical protein